jgi:hypothetical protein
MSRSSIKLATLAALLALAFSFSANQARADLVIKASVDGGAFTTLQFQASSPAGTFSAGPIFNLITAAGPFAITLDSLTGTNGSPSNLMSAELNITNFSTATHTLRLLFSINNYSLPAGSPVNMFSQAGGDFGLGTTLAFSDQAYFDSTNALGSTPAGSTNGVQNAVFNGFSFDTGTAVGSYAKSGQYSLTDIETYTLSALGSAHATDSIQVVAVPEPASIALLVAGVPVVGLLWARRRKAKVA